MERTASGSQAKKRVLPRVILTLTAVFLLLPFVVTVFYSFVKVWINILPDGYTTKYWAEVLTGGEGFPRFCADF